MDPTFFAFVIIALAAVAISGANTGTAFYNASALAQFAQLVGIDSILARWASLVLGTIATEGLAIIGIARAINMITNRNLVRKMRVGLLLSSVAFSLVIMTSLAFQLATGLLQYTVTNAIIGLLTPILAVTAGEVAIGDIYDWIERHQPTPVKKTPKLQITPNQPLDDVIQAYWKKLRREDRARTYGEIALDVTDIIAKRGGLTQPVSVEAVKLAIDKLRKHETSTTP